MCGIGCKQTPAYTHALGQSLRHFVGADVGYAIFVWGRVPGQHGLELPWLSSEKLFTRETRLLTVCDSPAAIHGDLRGHVPMFWVDDQIGVLVPEISQRGSRSVHNHVNQLSCMIKDDRP